MHLDLLLCSWSLLHLHFSNQRNLEFHLLEYLMQVYIILSFQKEFSRQSKVFAIAEFKLLLPIELVRRLLIEHIRKIIWISLGLEVRRIRFREDWRIILLMNLQFFNFIEPNCLIYIIKFLIQSSFNSFICYHFGIRVCKLPMVHNPEVGFIVLVQIKIYLPFIKEYCAF